MDRYKEIFETWNKIASIYQDKFMNMDLYNEMYDVICNVITQPQGKVKRAKSSYPQIGAQL